MESYWQTEDDFDVAVAEGDYEIANMCLTCMTQMAVMVPGTPLARRVQSIILDFNLFLKELQYAVN